MSGRIRPFLSTLAFLLVWETFARCSSSVAAVLPPPSKILLEWIGQRDIYALHTAATLASASLGFLIGCSVAVLSALIFALWPVTEHISRGVTITIFAVPTITVGQVLVVAYDGMVPQVVLAALCVYFPTMIATLIGLRDVDRRVVDVVRLYGGRSIAILRFIRLRSAVPGLLAGLKVAAPAALLGSIIAEFGSGARWGIGSFLLGAMGEANPISVWSIGLAATLLAAIAYGFFACLAQVMLRPTLSVTVAANTAPDDLGSYHPPRVGQRILLTVVAVVLPFCLWWLAPRLLGLSPVLVRDPFATFHYLFLADHAAAARATLLNALLATVPVAGLGLVFGLFGAFVLACLSVLKPAISHALLPPTLVLQSMPLVALTPMIVLIFGRDLAATLVVTMFVVFFPAYVTLMQGFAYAPRAALDVVRCYGDRPVKALLLVSIPSAMPYLFAAARLVAPRALLGTMIAEYLATGKGMGQLLNASRGILDFGMIWAAAFVSVLTAICAYEAVGVAERLTNRWQTG